MTPSTTAGGATCAADGRRRAAGRLALGVWALHAADCLFVLKQPWNLLWACNLAALAVGAGLLLRRERVAAVGTLWLAFGLPIWLIDLAGGGEFIWTAAATHLGGLAAGAWAFRSSGPPAGAWRDAALAGAALQELSRLAAPPAENVNLAHAVWPGWEGVFSSFPVYRAFVLALMAASCWAGEAALRRLAAVEETR